MCSFGELLSEKRKFVVPPFQRHYGWDKKDWERFLQDISNMANSQNSKEIHFIGNIILNQSLNQENIKLYTEYRIIDGQQRIATFCIFLLAIKSLLNQGSPADKNTEDKIKETLIIFQEDNGLLVERSSRIELQESDEVIFKEIVSGTPPEIQTSDERIYQCWKYFFNKLKEGEIRNLGFRTILDAAKQKIKFILIEVKDPADAFKIFESINNSGKGLTSSDLVKIDFFEVWKRKFLSEDDLKSKWNELRERVGEKNLDNFFFSFLNTFFIKKGEYSENNFSTFFRKLLGISEGKQKLLWVITSTGKQIKKTPLEEFLELIIEASKIYRKILNPQIKDWGREYYFCLLEIKNLELKQLYPFVIALKLFPSKGREEKEKILKKVIVYFFRKYKVKKQKFAPMEVEKWVFYIRSDVIKNILNSEGVKEEVRESWLFWEKLVEINLKPKLARFVLKKLYMSFVPDIFILSSEEQVEHIFSKNCDEEWWKINEWKLLKQEEGKEKTEKVVFALGNQTLITSEENIAGSNKIWKEKKQEFKEKTCLSDEDDWTDEYKKRVEVLENNPDRTAEEEKELKRKRQGLKILEDNNPNFFSKDDLLPYDIEKRTKFLRFWLQEKELLFIDEETEKEELFKDS